MPRGKTDLTSNEYDSYLASKGKHRELAKRNAERKSKGYKGWHFGLGDKPVFTRNKEEFKRELNRRGLVMKDDVARDLR